MTKEYTWNELLVIGGYQFSSLGESTFDFPHENIFYLDHLVKLLNINKVEYHFDRRILKIVAPVPSLAKWINSLTLLFKGNHENGSLEGLYLDMVEVPMLGIIGQLRRLGLRTVGCCSGHEGKRRGRNRYPYVEFESPTDALIFMRILQNLNYSVHIEGTCMVRIPVEGGVLFEIGLVLSKIEDIDNYLEIIMHEREAILETLLLISGSSGNEELIRGKVLSLLEKKKVSYWKDDYGNVLGYKRNGKGPTILLSAHLDIYEEISSTSFLIKNGHIWKRNIGILGADDRAGVAIILNILADLQKAKFTGTIKFAFTVEEETHQRGAEQIDKSFFKGVDYAISLDRRNNSDIVTRSGKHQYCSDDFGHFIERASMDMEKNNPHYKMTDGGISDLRVWSALGIPSVNLSIGYHNEHEDGEYLCLKDWHKAHDLVLRTLNNLRWRYQSEKRRERRGLHNKPAQDPLFAPVFLSPERSGVGPDRAWRLTARSPFFC